MLIHYSRHCHYAAAIHWLASVITPLMPQYYYYWVTPFQLLATAFAISSLTACQYLLFFAIAELTLAGH
jgi:hypothetical protein